MKTTRIIRAFGAAVLSTAFLLALAPASRAANNLVYYVTLNVASLDSNPDAPFALDLQLAPGSDNVTNTVTLSNFTAFGGSFTGVTFTAGGESGSVGTSVVLTNSNPSNNEFAEGFSNTTTSIMFKVNETNNAEVVGSGSPAPDQFNVFIDDNNTADGFIPTTDPSGNDTLVNDAMVASTNPALINNYSSVSPDAGVTSAVPEPGSAALLLLGAAALLARRKRPATVPIA